MLSRHITDLASKTLIEWPGGAGFNIKQEGGWAQGAFGNFYRRHHRCIRREAAGYHRTGGARVLTFTVERLQNRPCAKKSRRFILAFLLPIS
jgi:hypothetical protein